MDSEEEVITASVSIFLLMAGKGLTCATRRAAVSAHIFLDGIFRWHDRLVIHRGVHGVNVYQT